MSNIRVKSNLGDYQVNFENNLDFLRQAGDTENFLCIIDRNVYNIYKNELDILIPKNSVLLFDAVEQNKTIDYAITIFEHLVRKRAKRNMLLISIGGGITQDVTGFVASTIYRGIKWIFVPTTFLAQTDSCIGSKTSLNFGSYKNLIGTFYPPKEIFIYPSFINTLSEKDFYSGLGEAIKLQLMSKKNRFDFKEIAHAIENCKKDRTQLSRIIYENLMIKLSYIENDEFDLGQRNLLNYGHCFGHALESASNYEIPHGIAVTIGIIFANTISLNRGLLTSQMYRDINEYLLLNNIKITLKPNFFNEELILKAMQNDKKREGKDLSIIIPNDSFNLIKVNDMKVSELTDALRMVLKLIFI